MNIFEVIKTAGYAAYSGIAKLLFSFSDSGATGIVIKNSVKGLAIGVTAAIGVGIAVFFIGCAVEFFSERCISDPNHASGVLVKRRFSFRWETEEMEDAV